MRRRSLRGILLTSAAFGSVVLGPYAAAAGDVAVSPPVNFTNNSDPNIGSTLVNLTDSYAKLMLNNPEVMAQNIATVVRMTQTRTAEQTLAAIHDDRTNQQYSVLNGLGVLTPLFMTGAGSSASGTAPTSLTSTTYATATLQNYAANINYLNSASWGAATFSDPQKTPTPLAGAVNFVNNIVRANSSTEPTKRTFERYMGTTGPVVNPASLAAGTISPLDPRYQNYSAVNGAAGRTSMTTADTANFVVPGYLTGYAVPAVYGTVENWVKGFTVTQAMIDANGGKPISVPNVGTYDAAGNFTPYTFGVGDYVPGIGDSPRPFRLTSDVNVPTLLYQITNGSNPYADGAFISGHTNSGYTQALGLAFLVPQQYQGLLARAADLGNNRILAGMHSPLDVMGARIFATAVAATNIYNALYDASGNRIDWTDPTKTNAYALYKAVTDTQAYLAQACGTASVAICVEQATLAGGSAADAYGMSAQRQQAYRNGLAEYTYRLTYDFAPSSTTPVAEVVPVQAQVLLLTRFPYLTDQQRLDVLQSTALAHCYPLLCGNTWDGWGRLNLYAASAGYGALNGNVEISMDAALGGYNALDIWRNDIGDYDKIAYPNAQPGSLTKRGSGTLVLTGNNSYSGGTDIEGGTLVGHAKAFGSGAIIDNATLVIDQETDGTLANAISGIGTLQKINLGKLGLTGTSSFSGATLVTGGKLSVDGFLGNSIITVQSGAALGGNGTVGGIIAEAGSTVAPGNSVGALNVAGDLTFKPGSTYAVEVNASGADRINVTGHAQLSGAGVAAAVSFTPGSRIGHSYTILDAGSVTGAFSGLTTNLIPIFSAGLSYGPTSVAINFTTDATKVNGLDGNQKAVAGALISGFNSGRALDGTLSAAVLTSSATPNGSLSQLAGETGTASAPAIEHAGTSLLALLAGHMTPPPGGTPGALGFASDSEPAPEVARAYAAVTPKGAAIIKAPPAGYAPRWGLWGSGFGGIGRLGGDAAAGSHDLSTSVYGLASGADYQAGPDTMLGFAVAGGGTNFSLSNGFGGGRSDYVQGAVYGRQALGAAYVEAAVAGGAHWVTSNRTVAVGTLFDQLTASYTAPTLAGRVEGGYRFVLAPGFGLTPYGAVDVQHVWVPAYAESATAGTGAAALAYAAQSTTTTRSELGLWADARLANDVVVRGRAAWVHDYNPDAAVTATFLTLPGASFVTSGAQRPANSALVSAVAEFPLAPSIIVSGKIDGEFGGGATTLAGTGKVRFTW